MKEEWFRAFMDASPEAYFRFAFVPARGFAYVVSYNPRFRARRQFFGIAPRMDAIDSNCAISR